MADRNLDAYYYSFDPTGCDLVDAVLEQVARAGKAFHCTSDWNEDDSDGQSPVAKTQAAANASAQSILALIAENERLRGANIEGADWVSSCRADMAELDQLRAEVEGLRERAEYWKQRAKSAEGHLFTSDWRAARHALHRHTAMASTPWDELTDAQKTQINSAAGAVIAEVNARRDVRLPHDAAMGKGGQVNG